MDSNLRGIEEASFISAGMHFIIYHGSSLEEESSRDISLELFFQDTIQRTRGLSAEELTKINEVVWNGDYQVETSSPDTLILRKNSHNCAVCLSNIEVGDQLRKLKCGHFFHKSCLDQWLKFKPSCPIDRKTVL
jgi:Ring finger domain